MSLLIHNPTSFLKKLPFEVNLGLHAIVGIVCAIQPQLVPIWILYIILIEGTVKVFRNGNAGGQAHLAAAYMASMEMISRMSNSGLPHELTKYAVIFILMNGLFARPRFSSNSWIFIFYFLLLIPSVLLLVDANQLEMARQSVSFNLAGPLCLAVSGIYFYRRLISQQQLVHLFQQFLLPMAATIAWLFISTPRISEIDFNFGANFAASGYGPNQMASLLGFGILIIGIAYLFRLPVIQNKWIALVFFGLLSYRGLLTFSRGGMAAPLIILTCLVVYFLLSNRHFRSQFGRLFLIIGLFALTMYSVYSYANQQTGNALFNRYAGINYGKQVTAEKYASGRIQIAEIDFRIFLDNPILGIGPGMGNDQRVIYGYGERVAAHIEFTRLLAEHGLFGIVALAILLFFPVWEFYHRRTIFQRFLLVAGVLFCLSFMAHSATRIALPMFVYGLAFIIIIPDDRIRSSSVSISSGKMLRLV